MTETILRPEAASLVKLKRETSSRFRPRRLQFRFNPRLTFWAACLLLFSFFGPAEAVVRLGVGFTALRAALFAILIPAVVTFYRKIARGGYVPVMSDVFVPIMAVWMALALATTGGVKSLLGIDTAVIIEFTSAYLAARCFFATAPGLEQFVKILLVVAIGLVGLGLIEEAARANVISALASKIFHTNRVLITTQYRMGLVRVRVSFEHSILYGAFFAISAPLFFYVLKSIKARLLGLATCFVGTFLSLSSGPILCFAIFASAVTFDSLFFRLRWRWALLAVFCAYGLAVILLTVDQPLESMIQLGTLDPQTGLYRLQIWHWIGYNLRDSWLFGTGGKDWVRPAQMIASVDSLWLVQSLRSGYVGVGLLVLSIAGAFFVWPPRQLPTYPNPHYNRLRVAVGISILQFVLLAFAVHIWGIMWAYLAMLLGIRAGLSEARFLPPEIRGDGLPPPPSAHHRGLVRRAGPTPPAPGASELAGHGPRPALVSDQTGA
jgi:hypothetical protein